MNITLQREEVDKAITQYMNTILKQDMKVTEIQVNRLQGGYNADIVCQAAEAPPEKLRVVAKEEQQEQATSDTAETPEKEVEEIQDEFPVFG